MNGGILILAEHLRGSISEITFEMIGTARSLAQEWQAPVTAVLVGDNTTELAAKLGAADQVLAVENPALNAALPSQQTAILKALLDKTQASLVLVAGTNVSMGIGPVLAQQANMPFINFCKAIRLEEGELVVTSQLFGGKILSDVKLPQNRGVVSIYPGAFPAEAGKSDQPAKVEKVDLPVAPSKVVFKGYIEPETGDVDITKQEVLVAVGRGIQSEDNVSLAEDLAAALGGAVCASRPVIDQGWLSLSRQVGKSGMTVQPRLYLAFGISGAPEHWEGMQNAALIVAVNTDPQAPIFDGAHYGVCADALDMIEALTSKIKAHKG